MLLNPRSPFVWAGVLAFLPACHSALPHHAWMDADSTLAVMAARADRLHSFAAVVDAHLVRRDGQSVRLEGAFAAQHPDHLRLQFWKLGRTVMDLTRRPDGVWVWTGDATAALQPETWLGVPLIGGQFFRDPATTSQHGGVLRMARPMGGDVLLNATINRTTLTLEEVLITRLDEVVGRIELDHYREISNIAVPMRWRFESHGDIIVMRLRNVEVNQGISEQAFVPPPRARRVTQER